jgi:hypothetical protein
MTQGVARKARSPWANLLSTFGSKIPVANRVQSDFFAEFICV